MSFWIISSKLAIAIVFGAEHGRDAGPQLTVELIGYVEIC
jgi:hypothetical protein